MKTIMKKGDDYLSAEESLGTILWDMGLVKNIKDEYGNNRARITDDCVIEVRRIRNKESKQNDRRRNKQFGRKTL